MNREEFDKFAAEYEKMLRDNVSASGEGPEFFAEYKVADMRRRWDVRSLGREPETIVDFGGGVGASAPHMRKYFPQARIIIADVSSKSLEVAEARGIDRVDCLHFDGETLPIVNESVDLVLAACVFHHISEEYHISLIREICRIVKSDGLFFVFEHNPWNPLTVQAVNTCPFDENAILISAPTMLSRVRSGGFTSAQVRYRIFVPGPLRALRPLERALTWLPLGAQYYVEGER